MNHSYDVKHTRVAAAAASAGTEITGDAVDTANFEGVSFIAAFGTIAAGGVPAVQIQGSDDNINFADLDGAVGSAGAEDDNGIVIVNVYRPLQRYLRPVITRTGGNAAVDGVVAQLYGPRVKPVEQGDDVVAHVVSISPEASS